LGWEPGKLQRIKVIIGVMPPIPPKLRRKKLLKLSTLKEVINLGPTC